MKTSRIPTSLAVIAAVVAFAASSWATDVGVPGTSASIKINLKNGSKKVKSVQKGPNVHLGAAATAAQIRGELSIHYVDSPDNIGVFPIPAPWSAANALFAKYKNSQAPQGPSVVKSAVVKNGVVAKVTAADAGGLDVSAPPGPAGVVTVLTIHNAADASTHRMCTLYSNASGQVVHEATATSQSLKLKGGVPVVCPSCSDGFRNGDETDVDCGGSNCAACDDGDDCEMASDCASLVCTGNVCQVPTCVDGVENGDETGLDCGGGTCGACPAGQGCEDGSDCESEVCIGNVCQAATCNDGVENGTETGLDCGGGSCPTCPAGQGCEDASDCASEVCTGNVCQSPTCSDGVSNANETGIDCGGGSCPLCPAGQGCGSASDCQSGVCAGNVCIAPSCSDGVLNGSESDLDCGGSCPGCVAGDTCNGPSDCASGICVDHVCQNPTCTDGAKNGAETDVDCGGPTCPDCALNKMCSSGGDCLSTFCTGGLCKCPSQLFTFNVSSSSGGLFNSAEWPGGTASQNGATGCSVTINRPNASIDLVCTLANPFSVNGFSGYSSCFGTGGEDGDGCQPVSCPPAGIGSCCNRRPSCSAALNGSGSARFFVQCQP